MPQKPVYCKSPILTIPHGFPASGTIRTNDSRIERLYQQANRWIDQPCLWEGLFRIACLVRSNPMEEPVAHLILDETRKMENNEFEGSVRDQVSKARAAFTVYEYNTDRTILRRIAFWLRYLEAEFDTLCTQDCILFCPADLMELLIRFYQVSGTKAVLRLCVKLRAKAFDWTTALQTFQQSIPIELEKANPEVFLQNATPEDLDYGDRQKLINHAEMLADGVRYTLYSGLFSGHGLDLSAGKTVWRHLSRHHQAICGGTTSDPFLCGRGSDKPVSNTALAAWSEAFAAQMILSDSEWAADELIRIVFNGLYDCLEKS